MKNKNIYKTLIIINAIVIIIALIYVNFYQSRFNGYIILPDNNVYYKKGNSISEYNKNIDKPQNIKVITSDNEYNLQFTKTNDDISYYENKKPTILEESLKIAYSKGLNIKLADFYTQRLDEEEVNKILKEHNISKNSDINVANKVSFDYNSDGINETIYFVSNLFDQTEYNKAFSFAYYVKDGEIIYLVEQVEDYENAYDLCIPYIDAIADFNSDNNYNLILGCEYFSEIPNKHEFYKLQDNIFKKY